MENKIHYVYKIVNNKNNKEYIGVRTHPNPEKDKYMGSSKILNNLYRLEGKENFSKIILELFNTRKEAEDYESSLLTEEFCSNSQTYNIQNTGNYSESKHGFRKDLWFDYYDEIREKYKNGETSKNLSKFYNCDEGTISSIINDIKRTNSETQQLRFKKFISSGARNTKIDSYIDEIIRLYTIELLSINAISKKFNIDPSSVKMRLKENNIEIRNHKQSQILRDKKTRKQIHQIWEFKEQIIKDNSNLNLTELSKKYGCDKGTIKSILGENYSKKYNNAWDYQKEIINKSKNTSIIKLSKEYNCSTTLINNIIRNERKEN